MIAVIKNGLLQLFIALRLDKLFAAVGRFIIGAAQYVWRNLPGWLRTYLENLWHVIGQLALCIDQLLNCLSGLIFPSKQVWADETMSSRCGRLGRRYPYKVYVIAVDALFGLWQGPKHCVRAYEKEKARYNCPPAMRTETKKAEAP